MRTCLTALAIGSGLLILGLAGWWWWTVPPSATTAQLMHTLDHVPSGVEGAMVLAQPTRAARWIFRRPQSLAPLLVASPPLDAARTRMAGILRAAGRSSHAPVAVWWRAGEMAMSAELEPGARRALADLADMQGLPWHGHGDRITVATETGLLLGSPAVVPAVESPRSSALVWSRDRLWSVTLRRSSLVAVTGAGARMVPASPSVSRLATRDAAVLLGAAADRSDLSLPLCLAFGRQAGWGVTIPDAALRSRLARALGSPGGGRDRPEGLTVRWTGVLGRVWMRREGDWVSLASHQILLPEAGHPPCQGEWGSVLGDDLGFLAERIRTVAGIVGANPSTLRTLDDIASGSRGLGRISWRLEPGGSVLTMEW